MSDVLPEIPVYTPVVIPGDPGAIGEHLSTVQGVGSVIDQHIQTLSQIHAEQQEQWKGPAAESAGDYLLCLLKAHQEFSQDLYDFDSTVDKYISDMANLLHQAAQVNRQLEQDHAQLKSLQAQIKAAQAKLKSDQANLAQLTSQTTVPGGAIAAASAAVDQDQTALIQLHQQYAQVLQTFQQAEKEAGEVRGEALELGLALSTFLAKLIFNGPPELPNPAEECSSDDGEGGASGEGGGEDGEGGDGEGGDKPELPEFPTVDPPDIPYDVPNPDPPQKKHPLPTLKPTPAGTFP